VTNGMTKPNTSDTLMPPLGASSAVIALAAAVQKDLSVLALLHDRELTSDTLQALQQEVEEAFLGLRLESTEGAEALALFRAGVADVPRDCPGDALDILASEYADIYLNYSLQAAPSESVWIDEDGLTLQDAMFELRGWYANHGLSAKDWRQRSEDHLVTQLQFLAHLAGQVAAQDDENGQLDEITQLLDEHLLRWIGDFAERVSTRCRTRFYAGLAVLTARYLDELRDLLTLVSGQPRPTSDEIEKRCKERKPPLQVAVPAPTPSDFVLGSTPTW
jgi:TorA maturation chaperone TorD